MNSNAIHSQGIKHTMKDIGYASDETDALYEKSIPVIKHMLSDTAERARWSGRSTHKQNFQQLLSLVSVLTNCGSENLLSMQLDKKMLLQYSALVALVRSFFCEPFSQKGSIWSSSSLVQSFAYVLILVIKSALKVPGHLISSDWAASFKRTEEDEKQSPRWLKELLDQMGWVESNANTLKDVFRTSFAQVSIEEDWLLTHEAFGLNHTPREVTDESSTHNKDNVRFSTSLFSKACQPTVERGKDNGGFLNDKNSVQQPFNILLLEVCCVGLACLFLGLQSGPLWTNFVLSGAADIMIQVCCTDTVVGDTSFFLTHLQSIAQGCLSCLDLPDLQGLALHFRKQIRLLSKGTPSPVQTKFPLISPCPNQTTALQGLQKWNSSTELLASESMVRLLLQRVIDTQQRAFNEKIQMQNKVKELRNQKKNPEVDLRRRLVAAANEAAIEVSLQQKHKTKDSVSHFTFQTLCRNEGKDSIMDTLTSVYRARQRASTVRSPLTIASYSELSSPFSPSVHSPNNQKSEAFLGAQFSVQTNMTSAMVTVGTSFAEQMQQERREWEVKEKKELDRILLLKEHMSKQQEEEKKRLTAQLHAEKERIKALVEEKNAQRRWERTQKRKQEAEILNKELARIEQLQAADEKRKKEEMRIKLVREREEKVRLKRLQKKVEKEKQDQLERELLIRQYENEVAENRMMAQVESDQREQEVLIQKYNKVLAEKSIWNKRLNRGNFEWKRGKLVFADGPPQAAEPKQTNAIKNNNTSNISTLSDWITCQDSNGQSYYFNHKTGVSSWNKPF